MNRQKFEAGKIFIWRTDILRKYRFETNSETLAAGFLILESGKPYCLVEEVTDSGFIAVQYFFGKIVKAEVKFSECREAKL